MSFSRLSGLILRAIALAMGISTFVLALLKDITIGSAIIMLSLGVICLAITSLEHFTKKQ